MCVAPVQFLFDVLCWILLEAEACTEAGIGLPTGASVFSPNEHDEWSNGQRWIDTPPRPVVAENAATGQIVSAAPVITPGFAAASASHPYHVRTHMG